MSTDTPATHGAVPCGLRLIRSLVILSLLLATPGFSPLMLVRAQSGQAAYDEAVARLHASMNLVTALRDSLERTRFDLDALAFELAFEEPEAMRDWVATHTTYQPYRGVLRGAEGTLVSASGNSFDRSLLLTFLLESAGYDTRIAVGHLDEAAAQSMLATAATAHDDGSWRGTAERMLDAAAQLAGDGLLNSLEVTAALQDLLEPDTVDAGVHARAEATAGLLADAIQAHGISLGGDALPADLLAAAAEHAWVEYRLGEGDAWTPLPLGLPGGVSLPVPDAVIDSTVPDEYVHRVRIQAFVESKEGDSFEVNPVMDAWEQPAALLNGVVVTYANVPSALGELGDDALIGDILDASAFFLPYVRDSLAPGGQAFDLDGALLLPAVASDPAAGVFRGIRSGLTGAVGALSGIGLGGPRETGEPLALTAHWLEYTLVGPGVEGRVHTRRIFDRVGPEERASGGMALNGDTREEAELAIVREERLMTITGDYRPEWVLDQFFARLLDAGDLFGYVLALQHGVETDIVLDQAIQEASPLEHLLTALSFDAGARVSDAVSYRAEPTLLSFGTSLRGTREESVMLSGIDIISNARVALQPDSGGTVAAPEAALLQGIWETSVESEIMEAAAVDAGVTKSSAATTLARALDGGAGLLVLEPGDDVLAAGLSGAAAGNVERDLAAGFLVVLPDTLDHSEAPAWWRVMADTGETLGITADGRGSATLEYSIIVYDRTFTLLFALKGLADCEHKHSRGSPAQACCLLKAHINNMGGLAIGGVLGGALTGVTAATAGLTFTLGSEVMGLDYSPHLDCGEF